MKTLKQLALVALVCYGASIVAAYGFGPGGDMTEEEYNQWMESMANMQAYQESPEYKKLMTMNDMRMAVKNIYSDFNIISKQKVSYNDTPQSRIVKNRNEAFDRINYSLDEILKLCPKPENQSLINAIEEAKIFIASNIMLPLHYTYELEKFSAQFKRYLDKIKNLVDAIASQEKHAIL